MPVCFLPNKSGGDADAAETLDPARAAWWVQGQGRIEISWGLAHFGLNWDFCSLKWKCLAEIQKIIDDERKGIVNIYS